ncbi:MAG: 4-(cytidine 5'-diphospho)-2-C-methyl-D-erythritol kinase [Spirochaetales bacterium]|nr:4-(cytidine 5'-diphospho)-2-C-methyl-D-erythritol kinase [Spirochaetales bacterium]
MTVNSYAKINLYLNVVSRYKNGYHGLRSIFALTDLCDVMTYESSSIGQNEITVGNALLGEDNLISKAAAAFRSYLAKTMPHITVPPLKIHTEKHIPMGGGLGGGSSNAAAMLNILNRLCGSPLSAAQLCHLGASLGADVPFFIRGGVQRVFGIGQITAPMNVKLDLPILLVFPKTRVNTAAAYSAMDDCHICGNTYNEQKRYRLVRDGLITGNIDHIATGLYNKFEEVIFPNNPELPQIKSDLVKCGALAALMSGSGSTMFGLCRTPDILHNCADKMRKLGYEVFLSEIKQKINRG